MKTKLTAKPRGRPKRKTMEETTETEAVDTTPVSTTPLPENVVVKFDTGIQPLGLNLDLGRQDLDLNFRRIEEKVNEIIKKVN